jgi:hypothetical protein
MADDTLRKLIEAQSKRGVKLAGKQRKQLNKAIQQSGKGAGGKKITAAEVAKAKKKAPQAVRKDYLATVARTFQPNKLSADLKKRLGKRGFERDESGYFTKAGKITQSAVDKAKQAGFSESDIRSSIAGFNANRLDPSITKFLTEGGGFKLNPETGQFESTGLDLGTNNIPSGAGTTGNQGPFAGINPDDLPGVTPAEFDFAAIVDPFKIEAKSRERLGLLQAGLGGYLGRLQAASAERINRGTTQAERDINRLAQSANLLGQKLNASTEFDIARINRLTGLQQAQTQQATNLYNLIPSAFSGATI